jgi:hypothetical protein
LAVQEEGEKVVEQELEQEQEEEPRLLPQKTFERFDFEPIPAFLCIFVAFFVCISLRNVTGMPSWESYGCKVK